MPLAEHNHAWGIRLLDGLPGSSCTSACPAYINWGAAEFDLPLDEPAPESIPFPEMPGDYVFTRSVPAHELLLIFRDDAHAIAFHDWLMESGWTAFCHWANSRS